MAGIDSDFFGDEAPTATPMAKRRNFVGKQRPMRCPDALESGDAASEDDRASCHLCEQPIDGQQAHTHCGKTFHMMACWPAIRFYRRMMGGDHDKISRANALMLEDPRRWRQELQPLLRKPGQTRSSAARAAIKQKLAINDKYTKEEYIRRGVVLNLQRFKKYMNDWEAMDESDAEVEFQRLLNEQGSTYFDGFEDRVLAPGNDEVVKLKGTAIHKQDITSFDVAPSHGAPPSAPAHLVDGRVAPDALRSLRASPAFPRRRSASPSALGSDSDAAADSSDGDGGSTAKHTMKSSSSAVTSRRSGRARSVSGSSPMQPQAPLSSPRSGLQESAKTMSPLEFMQAKSNLKKLVDKHTSLEKSRKYIVHRIDASISKLSNEQFSQLPSDPTHVKSSVVAKMDSLKGASRGIDKVKVDGWAQVKNSVIDAIDALENQCVEAEADWKAIDFLVQQKAIAKKAERSSDRYKKDRIALKLTNHNWGTNIAKKMVQWIEGAPSHTHGPLKPLMNAGDDFDQQVVNLWTSDFSDKNSFKVSLMNEMADIIQGKRDGLSSYVAESSTLCGAQTKLDIGSQSLKPFLSVTGSDDTMGLAGTEPWIMNGRPWAARCGPSAFPLLGFGCWVQTHNENVTHMLLLIQAYSVLEQGISLSDIMSFLNTPTGLGTFADSAYTIAIGPHELAWIPYGYIPIPLVTEPLEDDKPVAIQDQTKQARLERDAKSIGTYTILTVFSKNLAAMLDANTWLAIHKFNLDHCKKNAHRTTWAGRHKVMTTFAEVVSQCRTT